MIESVSYTHLTLIAMWYTVKTSLNIQKENNDAMNIQLQSDIQRRDKESREKFANEIANHLGVYITDISKYYYANIELEKLEERKEHVAERLSEQEEEEHCLLYTSPSCKSIRKYSVR